MAYTYLLREVLGLAVSSSFKCRREWRKKKIEFGGTRYPGFKCGHNDNNNSEGAPRAYLLRVVALRAVLFLGEALHQ